MENTLRIQKLIVTRILSLLPLLCCLGRRFVKSIWWTVIIDAFFSGASLCSVLRQRVLKRNKRKEPPLVHSRVSLFSLSLAELLSAAFALPTKGNLTKKERRRRKSDVFNILFGREYICHFDLLLIFEGTGCMLESSYWNPMKAQSLVEECENNREKCIGSPNYSC